MFTSVGPLPSLSNLWKPNVRKDKEYLHIDYSLNYVTAVLHNVIVCFMFELSEFDSDLVPRPIICPTFQNCQPEHFQSTASLCFCLLKSLLCSNCSIRVMLFIKRHHSVM